MVALGAGALLLAICGSEKEVDDNRPAAHTTFANM